MISERERAELLVLRANGSGFQDLFAKVMCHRYGEFTPIKAYGSYGDGGNDGWLTDSGTFFQVYGPEDIKAAGTMSTALKKIQDDAHKIIKSRGRQVLAWRFVINDKFTGVPEPIDRKVMDVAAQLSLPDARAVGSEWLVRKMFELPRQQLLHVLGLNDHQPVIEDMRRVQDFVGRIEHLVHLLENQRDNDAGWIDCLRTFVDDLEDLDDRIVAADEMSAHEVVYGAQIELGRVVKQLRQVIDGASAQIAGARFNGLSRQVVELFYRLEDYSRTGTPPAPDHAMSIVREPSVVMAPDPVMPPPQGANSAPASTDAFTDLAANIGGRQTEAALGLFVNPCSPHVFDGFAADIKRRQAEAATVMFGTPPASPSASCEQGAAPPFSGGADIKTGFASAHDEYERRRIAAAKAMFPAQTPQY